VAVRVSSGQAPAEETLVDEGLDADLGLPPQRQIGLLNVKSDLERELRISLTARPAVGRFTRLLGPTGITTFRPWPLTHVAGVDLRFLRASGVSGVVLVLSPVVRRGDRRERRHDRNDGGGDRGTNPSFHFPSPNSYSAAPPQGYGESRDCAGDLSEATTVGIGPSVMPDARAD
jgi:hypothetical protein